jgi:hypothetical protein
MIGLRTKWGIQKVKMEAIKHGSWNQLMSNLIPEENQLFIVDDTSIKLSASGKLVADRLASDLFFD